MKLKSLLMGSAAAMLAGTSSFAADAVVAEPEAVEYVKVCDAYGAGYFFIPGTERCIQLSGEIRFEYRLTDADVNVAGVDDTRFQWAYRTRFQVRSANESDFGTIRTRIRFEQNNGDPSSRSDGDPFGTPAVGAINGTSDSDVFVQAAQLSIGGFEVGMFDNYWSTNTGYGNLRAMADGYYGYDQALYAQYTYEVAGFAVTAGVEQTLADDGIAAVPGNANFAGDDLNLYIGANYGGSWGNVAATLYYDNFLNEADYKVALTLNPIEGLSVKGWVSGGDGIYSVQSRGLDLAGFDNADGSYAYGISAGYTFGDFTPYIGYSDTNGAVFAPGFVAAGVVWAPSSTDGLVVQGEVNYVTEDRGTGSNPSAYRLRLIKSF